MRHLRKRLTCVNRENDELNEIMIGKILKRYVDKMVMKGWSIYKIYTGNSFLKYEAIVIMYKD